MEPTAGKIRVLRDRRDAWTIPALKLHTVSQKQLLTNDLTGSSVAGLQAPHPPGFGYLHGPAGMSGFLLEGWR